jgi:predicted TIM-barrel fold metal-dependent hydrolase
MLQDPSFLGSIAVEGLPESLVDMHQILPAMPGVLDLQLFAMKRFSIERVLVQSVPPQATSLWGNEQLRELASERGDLFWISQFLDPRMPNATEALEKLAAAGARVIKLLPPAGFQPDDHAFDEFWATMERLRLVAMVHTGFITARHKKEEKKAGAFLNSRFANPLFFDQPARKFPDLTIILCHLGGALWYEEGAQMVTQHDNVWADVSGFGLFALDRLLALKATLDWRKVFWGNDSPPFAYPFNLRLHLDVLRRNGAEHLAPALFCDNGRTFGKRFLAPTAGA